MSSPENSLKSITQVEVGILKTMLYYDIFDYPLTEDEILRSNSRPIDEYESLNEELEYLVSAEMLFKIQGFYLLHPKTELVERRLRGNHLAEKKMKLAIRIGRWIGSFPFVTAVMLSGSLSKGYMDQQSDIDYFIITQPGRLWLARTLLVLFKRLFLLNSHKYFCVNYFLDSHHLEIEDKNIFTATEIVTLIPAYNPDLYFKFIQNNQWVREFYPNFPPRTASSNLNGSKVLVKKVLQFVLDNRIGDRLDGYFREITNRRWVSKYAHLYQDNDFERAFRSRNYVSKNHPRDFQRVITSRYSRKIAEFEQKHSIELT